MPLDTLAAITEQNIGRPIRTVIADDERLARTKLRVLLDSEPKIQIVAECENGRQTISAIRDTCPIYFCLIFKCLIWMGLRYWARSTQVKCRQSSSPRLTISMRFGLLRRTPWTTY